VSISFALYLYIAQHILNSALNQKDDES